MILSDNSTKEHFSQQVVELVALDSFIIVQDSQKSGFPGSARRQDRASESNVYQLLNLIAVNSRQVARSVVVLGRALELAIWVLHFGIGHTVPQLLLLVLGVMDDMHDFVDPWLSSWWILDLKEIGCKVEPVFNFLLVAVTIIADSFEHLDRVVKVVASVIDIDGASTEQSIFFDKELFSRSESFDGCLTDGNRIIVLELGQIFRQCF